MNITKTELPTRPFTVKKFKMGWGNKEYIVVEYQYHSTIEATEHYVNGQKQSLKLVHHLHYSGKPTDDELIRSWHKDYSTLNLEGHILGGTEELKEPFNYDLKVKPTLLQWIKNLFKKKL